MDRMTGLMHAPAAKRYKSFAVTAADTQAVWLLPGKPPYVWQNKELAKRCCPDAEAACVEIHDFCSWLAAHGDCTVRVCPNGNDWVDVSARELLTRLQEELELVE